MNPSRAKQSKRCLYSDCCCAARARSARSRNGRSQVRRTPPDDDAYDSESDFAPEDQAARAARLRAERGWVSGKGPFTRLEKKRQDEFLDHLMMASVSMFLVVFVAVLAMK